MKEFREFEVKLSVSFFVAGIVFATLICWIVGPFLSFKETDREAELSNKTITIKAPVAGEFIPLIKNDVPKIVQEVYNLELFWEAVTATKGPIEVNIDSVNNHPRVAYYKRFGSEGNFCLMSQVEYKKFPFWEELNNNLAFFYSNVFVGAQIEKEKIVFEYRVERDLEKGIFALFLLGVALSVFVWAGSFLTLSILFLVGGKLKKTTLKGEEK